MKKVFPGAIALAALALAGVVLTSCESATVDVAKGYGPTPALPKPDPGLIPTVNIAPVTG